MKKRGTKMFAKFTFIINLTTQILNLSPYKDPQVANVFPDILKQGIQTIDTRKIIVRRQTDTERILYIYDVLAPDFSTDQYTTKLFVPGERIRKYITHYSDPDILFLTESWLFVMRISQNAVINQGRGVNLALIALEHLNGTNLVFTGGQGELIMKYDYTDQPLEPLVESRDLATELLKRVNMLDGVEETEIAWSGAEGKVFFVDRTGSMTTALRTFDSPIGNGLNLLYTFITPKKLVVFEDLGLTNIFLIDYSGADITLDYTMTPCGATIEPTSLAPVYGSTQAFLSCTDGRIKLIDLDDKDALHSEVVGVYDSGGFILTLRDHRIAVVHGDLNTGGNKMSLWDMRDERSCDPSCGSCGFLATEFGCLSCPRGQVLRLDGSCQATCLASNEYVDRSSKCQKCHSSCLSCSSGDQKSCLRCSAPQFRRSDGSCGLSCYSYDYVNNKLLRECSRCHPQCLSCSGGGTSQCLSCEQSAYRFLSGSWCSRCSSKDCPRCSPDSSCYSCALSPTPLPKSCPESTAYSLSLKNSADLRTDEKMIHLVISLDSKEIKFSDLQFMLEYGFFTIKADSLEKVGKARYSPQDRSLVERGQVSTRFNNSLEYLVHKGNISKLMTGEFNIEVTVNNTAIRYRLEPNGSASPSLILLNRTRAQLVILPEITFVEKLRHNLVKRLNNSLEIIRKAGASNAIISSIFLSNLLGVLVRFFQIAEVLINLSLVNSRLGILMEFIMEVLRALKFPLKLPKDLLWTGYRDAAD